MIEKIAQSATDDALQSAANTLLAGNLVAFPTETVYGLGADATNEKAVTRIYEVKGRPINHPLIVHISAMSALKHWVSEPPEYALALARAYWPGPMTLILKRSNLAKDFITGGQESVGIRIPNHPVALALLEKFQNVGGLGIAAPSANRFGQISPTTAAAVSEELIEYLSPLDQILDGGQSEVGIESTIINCTSEFPTILRPGEITEEMIRETTGLTVSDDSSIDSSGNSRQIRVSGSFEKHYAPQAKVLLDQPPISGQGFIALANSATPVGVIRLAAPTDNQEYARVLYSALRKADQLGLSEVVLVQPTGDGIAIAIRDRLLRAARGR